jgi:hypothetical protein
MKEESGGKQVDVFALKYYFNELRTQLLMNFFIFIFTGFPCVPDLVPAAKPTTECKPK